MNFPQTISIVNIKNKLRKLSLTLNLNYAGENDRGHLLDVPNWILEAATQWDEINGFPKNKEP